VLNQHRLLHFRNFEFRVLSFERHFSPEIKNQETSKTLAASRILRGIEKIQAIAYNPSPVCEPDYSICYQQSGGSG